MGIIYSHIRRKMMRFNVENRAHRLINREKPAAAPRYPTEEKILKEYYREKPVESLREEKKDENLDQFLKEVYVKSLGPAPEVKRDTSKLPKNRQFVQDHEYGFEEPKEVPEGYCTLRQALQFITDHQGNPELWNSSKVAKEYKLDEKTVDNILRYYKTFNIYVPAVKEDKKKFHLDLKRDKKFIDSKTNTDEKT